MITVKDAAARAAEFARNVLEEGRGRDLQLEEVEYTKRPPRWLITLSMPSSSPLGLLAREYKMFTVDAETGEVLSMKIRELTGAS